MLELFGLYFLGLVIFYAVLVWVFVDSMADTPSIMGLAVISVMWPVMVLGAIIAAPFFGFSYTLILLKSRSGK